MVKRLTAPILLAALLTLPVTPGRAADDVSALVERAGEVFARECKGVLGFLQLTDSKLRSSIFNQGTHTESWVVNKDGVPQQMKVLRMLHDGKPAKESELRDQERMLNEGYKQGKGYLKLPFDPRHMDTYTFTDGGPCVDCVPGARLVRFKSARKDEQHGSGMMRIDATYHVTHFDFKPNQLPENANEGYMTFVRTEVVPGTYAIRSLTGDFKGNVAFMRGSLTLEQSNERYRRFKSVEEAIAHQP